MPEKNIFNGLREIRKQLGLTSEELGKMVGLNGTYITRIESRNIPNPSFSAIMRIASVLSKMKKIVNSEIDLVSYDSHFVKLILYFKNEADIAADGNSLLSKCVDNSTYLNDDELKIIKKFADYKRHEVAVSDAVDQLKKQFTGFDMKKTYGSVHKLNYAYIIKKMLENLNDEEKNALETSFSGMLNNYNINNETDFIILLLNHIKNFLPRFPDVIQKEMNDEINAQIDKRSQNQLNFL